VISVNIIDNFAQNPANVIDNCKWKNEKVAGQLPFPSIQQLYAMSNISLDGASLLILKPMASIRSILHSHPPKRTQ
jgi:hypothetical protein